jgi:hypothetical protein
MIPSCPPSPVHTLRAFRLSVTLSANVANEFIAVWDLQRRPACPESRLNPDIGAFTQSADFVAKVG